MQTEEDQTKSTMKAVRCCGQEVQVVDVPAPRGDGILVNVRSAGICASDLHMLSAGFEVPGTMGHEIAGTLSDGRAVAVEPLSPCGHCDMCVRGDYGFCRLGPGMIHGVGLDGGMAEQILVPARAIVPLPANVRAEDACLVEPLAVAARGIRRVRLQPDSRVAVIGAGSVGLAACAVLAAQLKTVHLSARHDAQKAAGERLGVAVAGEGALTEGLESDYDVVVECAGSSEALAQAARLCRPGGTVLLLGTYWEGAALPVFDVCGKGLTIIASFLYDREGLVRDVDAAASLLAQCPDLPEILITHRMPLADAHEAFAVAADRSAGAIKVVLQP